jgi:hypothetical protein
VWLPFIPIIEPTSIRLLVTDLVTAATDAVWSRDSSVGIATGYGLDDQGGSGSSSPGRITIFTSPYRPDRLWGPLNLL